MDNADRAVNPDNLYLIKKYCKNNAAIDVVLNHEYAEFQVRVWKDGIVNPDATYYTDCRADAIKTARLMFHAILATRN